MLLPNNTKCINLEKQALTTRMAHFRKVT